MTDTRPTLLIPVLFPDPKIYPIDQEHIGGLGGFKINLFGYWKVSADTSPEVVRNEHETEAEAVLYEMAAKFSKAGARTDIQLHFGPSENSIRELQDRIVRETESDAVLNADQLTWWQNILIPLRDTRNNDRIVELLTAFDTDEIFALELFKVAPDENAVEPAAQMLETTREKLLDQGFSKADIEITVEVAPDPTAAIAEAARNHNLVVLGETEQLDTERYFYGPVFDAVSADTATPILVVRK